MLKKTLILALAATSLATPAFAQSSTGTVSIDGSVADRCLFTTPNATISVKELSLQGSGENAGKLDADKLDGEVRTLKGWCNGTAASISVEAEPLLNTDYTLPAPQGFARRVDFKATAVANEAEAFDTSISDGAGTPESVGIFAGDVVVTLSESSAPGNGLLIAGDYSGQVLVTLTPNVSFNLPDAE